MKTLLLLSLLISYKIEIKQDVCVNSILDKTWLVDTQVRVRDNKNKLISIEYWNTRSCLAIDTQEIKDRQMKQALDIKNRLVVGN